MTDAPVTIIVGADGVAWPANSRPKSLNGTQYTRTDTLGWNTDMEAAPRDGTKIDIRATENESGEYRRLCNCKWGEYAICGGMVFEIGWIGTHHQYEDYTLTGWMHLPPE